MNIKKLLASNNKKIQLNPSKILKIYDELIAYIVNELKNIIKTFKDTPRNPQSLNRIFDDEISEEKIALLTRLCQSIKTNYEQNEKIKLMAVIDSINGVLSAYGQHMVIDGKRYNIDYLNYILFGRIKVFFRFISFLKYLEESINKYEKIFKDDYLDLINNINLISYYYFSGKINDEISELEKKIQYKYGGNNDEDEVFDNFLYNAFRYFENNVSKKEVFTNNLYADNYRKYGGGYFKFKLTKRILEIFEKSNVNPENY